MQCIMSEDSVYNQQDITCANAASHLDQLKQCASHCHFWSLDLEFSGLGNVKRLNVENVEERFHAIRQLTRQYAVMEVGLAFFGDFRSVFGESWDPRGTICYRIPCHRKGHFTSNSSAMSFMVRQGMDLNKVFTEGLMYDVTANKWDAQQTISEQEGEAVMLTHLLRLVIKHAFGKPLIVHNGWIDLMHVHNIAIGPVPQNSSAWVNELLTHIPLIIDTKYVAVTLWSLPETALGKLYTYNFPETMTEGGEAELGSKRGRPPDSAEREVFNDICDHVDDTETQEKLRNCLGLDSRPDDRKRTRLNSCTLDKRGAAHCASFDAFMTGRVFMAAVKKISDTSRAQSGATSGTQDTSMQSHLKHMSNLIEWTVNKPLSTADDLDVSPLVLYGLTNKLYLTHKELPFLLIKRHSF